MEVILASHAHHVPQVGLPQIEPVTKAIKLKTNPDGAKLFDIKKKFLFLKIKPQIDNKVIEENIPSEIHAAGTWTYIILTASLCLQSSGDKTNASTKPIESITMNKKRTYLGALEVNWKILFGSKSLNIS